MALKLNIDASKIAEQFKEFAVEVEQDLQKAVGQLAAMTHAKVVERANEELGSTRKKFMDSLGFEEIAPGVWVISIDEKGLFIEEGIEANHDMKPDLLKEGSKTSKSGNRYKVIPFDYGKPPSQMTGTTQQLVNQIKQSLKQEKVSFKKIERNSDGSPKVGKLHEFNLGGPRLGKGNTPALKGLSIYQSMTKSGNVKRDILTFRTVSSGPASAGKWHHPGMDGKKYLDWALEQATKEWENEILPKIMDKWK